MPGRECTVYLRARRNSKWEQRQTKPSQAQLQVRRLKNVLSWFGHILCFVINILKIIKTKKNNCVFSEVQRELVLEKSPKWEALSEVLQEIEKENQSSEHEPGQYNKKICLLIFTTGCSKLFGDKDIIMLQ